MILSPTSGTGVGILSPSALYAKNLRTIPFHSSYVRVGEESIPPQPPILGRLGVSLVKAGLRAKLPALMFRLWPERAGAVESHFYFRG
jgi:hypothetical protein